MTKGKRACPLYFMDLKNFQDKFNDYLLRFVDEKLFNLNKYTKDKFILSLFRHAKKLILSDGKRIRPYGAYLMYKNFGGKKENKFFKILIALEILHDFLLIHDDIMDKGLLRRGVVTTHIFTAQTLKKMRRRGDLNFVGLSQAICLGDLLYLWSSEIFSFNPGFKNENFNKARDFFYKMLEEVIIGQIMDIDCITKKSVSDLFIRQKTLLKSASYTFIRPFQIGAALAGANEKKLNFCYTLGKYLGMAFQIRNDMIDIIGVEKDRKTPLGDIALGEHSFFTQYIFKNGSSQQKKDLKRYFGKKIAKENQEKIINLFYQSKAIEFGKKMIDDYLKKAFLIQKWLLKKEYKDYMLQIIKILKN